MRQKKSLKSLKKALCQPKKHLKNISWEEVDDTVASLIEVLSQYITMQHNFDYVHGILRGGTIPAIVISHALDIPYLKDLEEVPSHTKVLIIDDICETGKTIEQLKNKLKPLEKNNDVHFTFASLFLRKTAKTWPMFWGTLLETADWLLLPWEVEKSSLVAPKSWRKKVKK